MKTIDNTLKAVLIIETWGKGGTETYVSGLIRELLRNSVDVILILLKDPSPVAAVPAVTYFLLDLGIQSS